MQKIRSFSLSSMRFALQMKMAETEEWSWEGGWTEVWVHPKRRGLLAQASKKIRNHSQTAATAKIMKCHSAFGCCQPSYSLRRGASDPKGSPESLSSDPWYCRHPLCVTPFTSCSHSVLKLMQALVPDSPWENFSITSA